MSQSKKRLLLIVIAFLVMFTTGPGACGQMAAGAKKAEAADPLVKTWVPPSQRDKNLTAEEENELLAEVEFSLRGTSTGEVAVFVDETMCVRLTVGKKVRVPLTGNDRCSVNLKILNAEGDWEHAASVGCIDHTAYASIGFTVDGTSVKSVSEGAWR